MDQPVWSIQWVKVCRTFDWKTIQVEAQGIVGGLGWEDPKLLASNRPATAGHFDVDFVAGGKPNYQFPVAIIFTTAATFQLSGPIGVLSVHGLYNSIHVHASQFCVLPLADSAPGTARLPGPDLTVHHDPNFNPIDHRLREGRVYAGLPFGLSSQGVYNSGESLVMRAGS